MMSSLTRPINCSLATSNYGKISPYIEMKMHSQEIDGIRPVVLDYLPSL
jgi:hypothetical protein